MFSSEEQQLLEPNISVLVHSVLNILAQPKFAQRCATSLTWAECGAHIAFSATRTQEGVFDAVELLRAAILARVGVRAPHSILPDELWGFIWGFLPQRDLFTVSRVSQRWRSVSISTQSLWTEIDYASSIHEVVCSCDACLHDERNPPCIGCGRRVPHTTDNLKTIRTVISRSENLLLNVDIYLAGDTDWHPIADLLHDVSHRIGSLHLSLDTKESAPEFLRRFNVLPSLHRLTVFTRGTDDEGTPLAIFHDEHQLPVLRHLEVDGHYQIGPYPLLLPAVFVRHPLRRIQDFLCVLATCTKARHIHWYINDSISSVDIHESAMPDLALHVKTSLSNLLPETVIVEQLTRPDVGTVLDFVHVPALPYLGLGLYNAGLSDPRVFDIFTDIKEVTRIYWHVYGSSDERVRLVVVGSVTRSIEYPEFEQDFLELSLWDILTSLPMLDYLSTNSFLWDYYFFVEIPTAPLLREIDIIFESRNRVDTQLIAIGTVWKRSPQLKVVQFGYESFRRGLVVQDEDTRDIREFALEVVKFAEAFCLPLEFERLETLRISGHELLQSHERASLEKLAKRIEGPLNDI